MHRTQKTPSGVTLIVSVARVLLLMVAGWTTAAASVPRHFFLELDIAIERGGTTGVLFDLGNGIWGENSSVAEVPPGNVPHAVRLQLPNQPIRGLRFDPTADDSPVLLAGMRLLTDRGELLLRVDLKTLRPLRQIQSILPEGEGVRILPTLHADDPMLQLDLPPLQESMHRAMQRSTVTAPLVVMLAFLIGVAVLTAGAAAASALGSRRIWLGGGAVFLAVFGARLLWLNHFSRPVPFWDEWDGDVLYILIPFVGGFLDWGALVMPQWEHRILLTRVVTLFGTVLNGEWDPRVAMTVSAAMYAMTIALIGTVLLATRRWLAAFAALALAVFASLPYDFNNLLWGGQTQMYGLVLLAICTIGIASAPRVTALMYVGALLGSLISLYTMGAGMVGPACAGGICLVRAWWESDRRRSWFLLALIFVGAALLGVLQHSTSRAHVPLYATTFAQFQRAFIGILAWPLPPRIFWAALIWLPWLINIGLTVRRRAGSPLEWLAVGLGGWGLINATALGYARQYEGPPFDSRFFTPISMGAMASLCSAVALALRAPTRAAFFLPTAVWATVALGLVGVGVGAIPGARESWAARADHDHRIRVFLATGDRGPLLEKPPHHTGSDVADRLESPLLQQVLPAPYRRVLAARAAVPPMQPIEAGGLTLTVRTLMKAGPAIAAVGLICFGLFLWRVRPIAAAPAVGSGQRFKAPRAFDRELWTHRACYLAVALITIGWVLLYNLVRRDGLVDEPGHMAALSHFLNGNSGWPEAMPMLPGYHFVVVSLWKLFPHLELQTTARLVTAGFALLGFAAFALTWQRLHGRPAGRATLLFAVLPLTQPFTGMAYTDVPAVALALGAWWGQVSGRRAFAALALVGAVALRQTNLVWVGFFVLWEFFRPDESRTTFLRRVRWLLLLGIAAVVIVLGAGRLTLGSQHGNDFRFNSASLHFTALLVLVLGLPVWVAHAPEVMRQGRQWWADHPRHGTLLVLAATLLATVFALTFANPHIWNRELYWEGCTFTLLRNWPLVWIDQHAWLRAFSGLNVVVMTAAVAVVFSRQRWSRELWLVTGIGAVPVLTNSLVEPRYHIPGFAFVLCFLAISDANWRRLALWWALLTALHAPFVLQALSLW